MADDLVKKYYRVRNPRAMSEEESLKFMESCGREAGKDLIC